jgi:GDP-D-mannose dehydratase
MLTDITGHAIDVHVNPAFVRANEVHRLCGNPAKLQACTGPLAQIGLADTLRAMLASHPMA